MEPGKNLKPEQPQTVVAIDSAADLQRDTVRREMRGQLNELATLGQWLIYPLLLLVFVALINEIALQPLILWLLSTFLVCLLSQLNSKLDRKLNERPGPIPYFWFRNTVLAAAFGLLWGCLPLIVARWGNRDTLWLTLLVGIGLTSALALIQLSSRRIFYSTMVPLMALLMIAAWQGNLPWEKLFPVMLLYVLVLSTLHSVLRQQQQDRALSFLISKAQTAELSFSLQHHDSLTGLFNRAGLEHWLNMQLNQATLPNKILLVMSAIKDFADITALYGSDTSDKLLRAVANRFIHDGKGRFAIARFSGEGFVMIDARPQRELSTMLKLLTDAENQSFLVGDRVINIVLQKAWAEGQLHDFEDMLEGTSAKLHSHDKNLDDPVSLPMVGQRRELLSTFNHGLRNHEIQPWFQPIVDCETQVITGWEALVRWSHPTLGLITPNHFLDIARISNQIVPLTQEMLRGTIEFIQELQNIGQHDCAVVNVNFTATMLADKNTPTWLIGMLNEGGIHPSQIVLEVSEEEALELSDQFRNNILRMQDLGLRIAIDDFGTGYSNLSHLLDLPASTVKLDKRFIVKLPHDNDSNALARAILTLASGLSMKTVAEGVERYEQLQFLQANGCNCYQGFYASGALPKLAALDFAQRWRGKTG